MTVQSTLGRRSDLAQRQLIRHCRPIDGRYTRIHRHDPGEWIELSSLPGVAVRVLSAP